MIGTPAPVGFCSLFHDPPPSLSKNVLFEWPPIEYKGQIPQYFLISFQEFETRNQKEIIKYFDLETLIFNYLQLFTRTNIRLENKSTKFKHNAVALTFSSVTQAEWCWNVTVTVKYKYKATHHNRYWSVIKKGLITKRSFLVTNNSLLRKAYLEPSQRSAVELFFRK